ncbi:hypothetical protein ATANTOWER_032388 [Ataeniobius toweri]|uniref:Uncharacterized protein n=1 Tax=Ataeniobius toweri TaxID=208326 RepID=A0ABU7A3Z1_9TELE|nr:hypothetical protein [Ataeniobius toweri]
MAPMCLYACLTTLGHAPYDITDGALGYLLPDPNQGIAELLDSQRCNSLVSNWKHDVPEMFYWIYVRGAWRPVNGINSFILRELPAYSCHMRPGMFMHQAEPRTHFTSEGTNSGSKDFIPIPNGSQAAIVYPVQVCVFLSKNMPPKANTEQH